MIVRKDSFSEKTPLLILRCWRAFLVIYFMSDAILAFLGKSKVINKAIMDIGMGSYQWQLFCLCGFGWLADK